MIMVMEKLCKGKEQITWKNKRKILKMKEASPDWQRNESEMNY